MAIQFIVPCISHLRVAGANKCLRRRQAKTQNQLNALYTPILRDYAAGYGEIQLAMCATMVYGVAVPALYWLAAAGFGVQL